MNWIDFFIYLGVFIAGCLFVALFWFLVYQSTKKGLERRYKPEHDRGRPSNQYTGDGSVQRGINPGEPNPSDQNESPGRNVLQDYSTSERGRIITELKDSILNSPKSTSPVREEDGRSDQTPEGNRNSAQSNEQEVDDFFK